MSEKAPCEEIIWKILPCIRKHLAICLIDEHGKTQQKTAELLKISPAAVSQYVANKRGRSNSIESCDEAAETIRESAKNIAEGGNVPREICRICRFTQRLQKQKENNQ